MNIAEWFESDNIEHIKAFYHLQHTGFWPKGFIPDYVSFSPTWQVLLQAKMADNWIKHILKVEEV